MRPTVHIVGVLDGHVSDQVGLRTQKDRERQGEHDPLAVGKLLGCRIDDYVDLM